MIHTLELAQALHELGHDVCVYALDKDGTGFDYPLSCPYQAIPAQTAPDAIDALIEQRIQEFIDYLSQSHLTYNCYHAQDCISANALAKLVKDEKIPHFIRTVHHIEDYSNLYLQHCQDRSIRDAALCLCVSEHWQTQLEQQYQIKAPRVINAVNTRRFSPVFDGSESFLKQQLGLRGSPIYLTVGGIEPRKNSICLLKAFSLILQEYPNAQLIIAGGATLFDYQSYRDQFFALADQLKIEIGHSLILPGVIQDADLPTLYRIADAFVFPSVKEGWGLVILEAIASGIPVITSNHAPFTEFLFLQEALLVDPTSSDAIFQAMQSILNPTLAKSLITHSQAVLAQYTWETSAKMHINHYQQLLQSYA
ncbi:group 1 glycosyl transferase [Chroococcus sp. FPU101]|nr:group 1 glycosyl transferase [Chroococcus sp. FPU101]